MKIQIVSALFVMVFAQAGWSQTAFAGRPGITLENSSAVITYDLGGGSLADFHLKDGGLNPFTWNHPAPGELKPQSMGHFICYDHWGPASKAETKNGNPWHGEAPYVMWHIDIPPERRENGIVAVMSCKLPIAGMSLHRTVTFDLHEPIMVVHEQFTNDNKLGRIYNVVQHATVGPPFLDETMLIDTAVEKGFSQKGNIPVPEEPVLSWPISEYEGKPVDFRRLSSDNRGPGVVSFTLQKNAEYGWATTCNPGKALLVGYVWKKSDYPWLSMWRNVQDGKPAAFALEFGSTGFHQPFGVLVKKGTIWGRQLIEYIDSGETQEKAYTVFLATIPTDFRGVDALRMESGRIVLTEHGETPRTITVSARVLP